MQIWGLGDLIMTLPVVVEIARRHPDARLSVIVRGKSQAALLQGCDLDVDIIDMPPRSPILGLLRFYVRLRHYGFDMAFIGTRTTPLHALALRVLSGVRTIVGDSERFGFVYTHYSRLNSQKHRVIRMLDTLSLWDGGESDAPVFPLGLPASADADATAVLCNAGLKPDQFLIIHPGSGHGLGFQQKRMPPAMVQDLIRETTRDFPGMRVAIILGPDDMDLVAQFADLPPAAALISDVPFDTTKAIIGKSSAFVGGDTALGHIAAALNVPTITVAGPTRIDESRPYGADSIVVKRREPLACQPCWYTPLQGRCPYNVVCMTSLPIEAIFGPVRERLRRREQRRVGGTRNAANEVT